MRTYADVCSRLAGVAPQDVSIREHSSAYVSAHALRQELEACSVVVSTMLAAHELVSRSARMLTHAHVCSRMLTHAHVCSRMLTYASMVCSGVGPEGFFSHIIVDEAAQVPQPLVRMLACADVC